MASTLQVPVAPVRPSKPVPAVRRVSDSSTPHRWSELLLALVLTAAAFMLNATLIGSILGVPLFLLALALLTSDSGNEGSST